MSTTEEAAAEWAAARRAEYIEALKVERLGYERRELPDRVAEVDEQIAILERGPEAESESEGESGEGESGEGESGDEPPQGATTAPQTNTADSKPRSKR